MDNCFYEVEDLTTDERFREKFYVAGKPYLKFYGGFPLIISNGYNIGALCVLDSKPGKLSQLFGNLISNAIKFTPVNGEICCSLIGENDKVKITIKDNGIGMNESI